MLATVDMLDPVTSAIRRHVRLVEPHVFVMKRRWASCDLLPYTLAVPTSTFVGWLNRVPFSAHQFRMYILAAWSVRAEEISDGVAIVHLNCKNSTDLKEQSRQLW